MTAATQRITLRDLIPTGEATEHNLARSLGMRCTALTILLSGG